VVIRFLELSVEPINIQHNKIPRRTVPEASRLPLFVRNEYPLAVVAVRKRVSESLIDKIAQPFLVSHRRQLLSRESCVYVLNGLLEVIIAVVPGIPRTYKSPPFQSQCTSSPPGETVPKAMASGNGRLV